MEKTQKDKAMSLAEKMAEIAKKAISAEPAKKSGFRNSGYVPEKISSYEEMTEIARQYRQILADAKGKIFPIAQRVGMSARFDCFCFDYARGEFMPNSLPLGQADISLPFLTFRLDAGDYIQSPEISALGQEIFPEHTGDFLMVRKQLDASWFFLASSSDFRFRSMARLAQKFGKLEEFFREFKAPSGFKG